MKDFTISIFIILFCQYSISVQAQQKQQYNISKEKVLYTIGYAHLDSEWNWDYPTTIKEYIWNTMEDNFNLFEKYPDYVFNFTGSRRYKMMKEYYPESFKRVAEYINQGRWFISGSSVDEGEVNISSSESVIRQVLYGNLFFWKEFGKESLDYMLPDCFGFVATMPSVWSHAGLLGFSTQKLTWGSANGLPFNVGVWEGPDGKDLLASLNATSYGSRIVERLDKDSTWNARIQDNINKLGISFDFRFYGVGDRGGAPREEDVINAVGSINQPDSKFKVILTSSDQIYKDITPELRSKLTTFSGDLLLTEHSAGSLTSQSFIKRANRKNENLAISAEQAASIADWMGGADYPHEKINESWDLVLGSQMHDILPGTAILEAYEYAWNDEFIAMNGFSEVLKNSIGTVSRGLNTRAEGKAVVVYNPVTIEREDIVTAELNYKKLPRNIKVIDKNGATLPSQIISAEGNKLTVIFLANLPVAGLSVFDIRETGDEPGDSDLSVTNRTLENKYFKVTIDENGDIANIYDKRAARQVLSKPASLDFLQETPAQWPAWNMDWDDRIQPPVDYMNKEVSIRIREQGPVRVALEVSKKGQNSEIIQIISLSAGEAGKVIEVWNKIDWQSKEVSLKATFPTTVVNEFATYGLNTAAVKRTTNNEVKYEVPGRQWIDITDRSNNYGVSILEDCKYGSDKPDNSTLRLTLMYTPRATTYVYQGSQDWGIHDVKYAIYPHVGDWVYAKTPWKGSCLNNPPIAFETSKHNGYLGKEISLLKINTDQVQVMAFKKAEESDYYIVRVNELYGKDARAVSLSFPAEIVDAYEVNGQEKKIGPADFSNGILNFNMTRFLIRSFAVKLKNPSQPLNKPLQVSIELPFNEDGISFDDNRSDGNLENGLSLPGEMLPVEVVSEDIIFKVGSSDDGKTNIVAARGQEINLPAGDFNKLYILAASTEDTEGAFRIGRQTVNLGIQDWTGFVGQHYSRELYFNDLKVASIVPAFAKRDNIAWFASHRHTPDENDAYKYSYLYKYKIDLPKGAKSVTLPDNEKIKIFAITVANNLNDDVTPLQLLYDDFKDNKPVELRVKEYITPGLLPVDYTLEQLVDKDIYESVMSDERTIQYLQRAGIEKITVSAPSTSDYADIGSGNNINITYYATGKSDEGEEYRDAKLDISNIIDSQSGQLKDTVVFDNGEGRILIDLQKNITVDKINFYLNQFRNRGSQIFSIWASTNSSDITGNPKEKGWDYVGVYNGSTGRRRRATFSGISFKFENNLNCRYLMILTDGHWHGTEYFNQLDIFEKE